MVGKETGGSKRANAISIPSGRNPTGLPVEAVRKSFANSQETGYYMYVAENIAADCKQRLAKAPIYPGQADG